MCHVKKRMTFLKSLVKSTKDRHETYSIKINKYCVKHKKRFWFQTDVSLIVLGESRALCLPTSASITLVS